MSATTFRCNGHRVGLDCIDWPATRANRYAVGRRGKRKVGGLADRQLASGRERPSVLLLAQQCS